PRTRRGHRERDAEMTVAVPACRECGDTAADTAAAAGRARIAAVPRGRPPSASPTTESGERRPAPVLIDATAGLRHCRVAMEQPSPLSSATVVSSVGGGGTGSGGTDRGDDDPSL